MGAPCAPRRIRSLLQGAKTPANNLTRTLPSGSGMHQYFVKLVPVQYTPLDSYSPLHSFQVCVRERGKCKALPSLPPDTVMRLLSVASSFP